MNIRPCQPGDYQAVADIYNYYIEQTVISFEEEPLSAKQLGERVAAYTASYPWLVGSEGDRVLGYAYANTWQVRCAYRKCVETTIYLHPEACGKGVGAALYGELLPRLAQLGLHTAIAGIALPNAASVALHERFGFTKVAHFTEVGWKFERWVDVGYWQLHLQDRPQSVGAGGLPPHSSVLSAKR